MTANRGRLLQGAASTPLSRPAREESAHDQRTDGGKESETVGILEAVHALLADRIKGG